MTLKVILCQSFCQSVSNLVFAIDMEYLDESLVHMFMKMGYPYGWPIQHITSLQLIGPQKNEDHY
jgi:hypothetical protein